MSQHIVDAFEAIKIEIKDREFPISRQLCKPIFHFLQEEQFVGQVRKRVVQRHMRDFSFRVPPPGNVFERYHGAAIGYWRT